MVDCEIRVETGAKISFNASFGILPRIGEEVLIRPGDDDPSIFLVKRVVHADLAVHGKSGRPSIQLWVADATRS
jgi:hypothetical protein